jgi:pimeloyl-ACP methyl ester carboxylesterase
MGREDLAVSIWSLNAMALVISAVGLASCQPSEPSAESSDPVSGFAPVNDVELYYEIRGQGTPLILLHGGLGHSGHWENQIPVLSEHFKVISVDSRGHGRSTMAEQQISYSVMASDIVVLMDYLDIRKANTDRLIRVIASGANYNPSGVRPDVGEHPKMIEYFGQAMEDYAALSPDPTAWEAFLGNISQMWASEPNFTVKQLSGINVPLLLLDGAGEEFIYPEHTIEMAGLIPTATLIVIPETGHFGMWENPDLMNDAILKFLVQ